MSRYKARSGLTGTGSTGSKMSSSLSSSGMGASRPSFYFASNDTNARTRPNISTKTITQQEVPEERPSLARNAAPTGPNTSTFSLIKTPSELTCHIFKFRDELVRLESLVPPIAFYKTWVDRTLEEGVEEGQMSAFGQRQKNEARQRRIQRNLERNPHLKDGCNFILQDAHNTKFDATKSAGKDSEAAEYFFLVPADDRDDAYHLVAAKKMYTVERDANLVKLTTEEAEAVLANPKLKTSEVERLVQQKKQEEEEIEAQCWGRVQQVEVGGNEDGELDDEEKAMRLQRRKDTAKIRKQNPTNDSESEEEEEDDNIDATKEGLEASDDDPLPDENDESESDDDEEEDEAVLQDAIELAKLLGVKLVGEGENDDDDDDEAEAEEEAVGGYVSGEEEEMDIDSDMEGEDDDEEGDGNNVKGNGDNATVNAPTASTSTTPIASQQQEEREEMANAPQTQADQQRGPQHQQKQQKQSQQKKQAKGKRAASTMDDTTSGNPGKRSKPLVKNPVPEQLVNMDGSQRKMMTNVLVKLLKQKPASTKKILNKLKKKGVDASDKTLMGQVAALVKYISDEETGEGKQPVRRLKKNYTDLVAKLQ